MTGKMLDNNERKMWHGGKGYGSWFGDMGGFSLFVLVFLCLFLFVGE